MHHSRHRRSSQAARTDTGYQPNHTRHQVGKSSPCGGCASLLLPASASSRPVLAAAKAPRLPVLWLARNKELLVESEREARPVLTPGAKRELLAHRNEVLGGAARVSRPRASSSSAPRAATTSSTSRPFSALLDASTPLRLGLLALRGD
jgi:hypothetical protein